VSLAGDVVGDVARDVADEIERQFVPGIAPKAEKRFAREVTDCGGGVLVLDVGPDGAV
jgi:hypothetical protein